ncbi:hypothetical protein Poly59_30790 [Rubripirellula reticaptiva]|uniref:Uncharacterized protein n=2 Tax=Rubripirellula reticaptiva TaxID=2528013 RepID=A0A5C6ETS5_9BACT|nr:hypothetical protein Poly59_30790 [Rubripirellula reticaptiva]
MGVTMTCTGGRLAAFFAMDHSLSVPRDVCRYAFKPMNDDRKSKLIARDKAMRQARDKMLRLVFQYLPTVGFTKAGDGHFVSQTENQTNHIGFQKHTSGREVRVMSHVTMDGSTGTSILGPRSDAYTRPNPPNGIRYNLSWSTRDEDIARCADEYCRFINDVLIGWFANPVSPEGMA